LDFFIFYTDSGNIEKPYITTSGSIDFAPENFFYIGPADLTMSVVAIESSGRGPMGNDWSSDSTTDREYQSVSLIGDEFRSRQQMTTEELLYRSILFNLKQEHPEMDYLAFPTIQTWTTTEEQRTLLNMRVSGYAVKINIASFFD